MKTNNSKEITKKTKLEASTFVESVHHGYKPDFGQKTSDKISAIVGSWKFIIIQTVVFSAWIMLNVAGWIKHWDEFPFILLNLTLGVISTYTAPIIMMSQNRSEERDRRKLEMDFYTNRKAEREIEQLQIQLEKLETKKIDKILSFMEDIKK